VGMRERVELFGGTVEAGAAERGWRVHVMIPSREGQP
jgi:signal transduction histidine kinase